jgi:hypothetical protein
MIVNSDIKLCRIMEVLKFGKTKKMYEMKEKGIDS